MTADQSTETQRQRSASAWERWLLLALLLIAFGRVVWRLDGKNLWWDESLSLQRAESAWLPLLQGHLVIRDGFTEMLSIDQHPFTYFALLGLLARGAGESEFALRYLSAMSATLLVAAVWACGRRLAAMGVVPAATGLWAALVAAVHPFFLWYGQEARPYALWAMLAVLSTYLLLRVVANSAPVWAWRAGYALALFLFVTTHYFAVFLLPVHALLLYQWMARRSRRRALLVAGGVLVAGILAGLAGAWLIVGQGGVGVNFERVPLRILLPDLLNAFGLGLSVDIDQVWRLDVAIGIVALIGALWGLLDWRRAWQGGWLLAAFVLVPVVALRLASLFQPTYMNARHLSLIGGGYILLVGAGLAVLWRFQRWLATVLALVIVAGASYSSYNYFTLPEYGKDDFTGAGEYLAKRILPGDLLLLNPPFSRRIFDYYLPVAELQHAAENGFGGGVYGTPRIHTPWEVMRQDFEAFRRQYRRIWLVTSGAAPATDPEGRVETWLEENTIRLKDESFFSPTSFLDIELFLPTVPVSQEPLPMRERLDVVFGDQIRLLGYDLGPALTPQSAVPMTFYWQTLKPTEHHYKYVMRLVEQQPDGQVQVLATTEREPYDGVIPTIYWKPDEVIIEYSEIPPFAYTPEAAERYHIQLQIYRADTLEKLPVTSANGVPVEADGQTLLLPYLPELAQAR
jgi:4-amino-4-deoxy-L-arabinose transferase-like glycosyltransferase